MVAGPTTEPDTVRITTRLPTLTGMRFLAAFLVFTSHAAALGYFGPHTTARLAHYAFAAGYTGVEFFFILSGFVLTWSASDRDTPPRFWRRRFVKIYPNHLITWLLALVLALVAGETVTPSRVLPSLFLVHTWIPNLYISASINVPSWTLSCELLFYATFPWLIRLVRRIRPDHLWWWAIGLTATAMLLPLLVHTLVPAAPLLPGDGMSTWQKWLLVSFPPTRTLDFTLGILLARIVHTGRWINLSLPAAALLTLAGFAADLYLVPTTYGVTLPLIAPLGLLIAAGATTDIHHHPSPLRHPWMVRLGDLSYAFYLLHYLVLAYTHDALGYTHSWPIPTALALLTGLLLATVALAWILYTCVERPCMRHWSTPRTPTPRSRTAA